MAGKVRFARHLRRRLTETETLLWEKLRNRHFFGYKFRRQHPLGKWIADFACLERKVVIDADLHADQEKFLLEQGSSQDDIWGINLYPNLQGDEFIEFDSMINVRPRLKNMSRVVENKQLQGVIRVIIAKLVHTK
jgi:hypothetical protein